MWIYEKTLQFPVVLKCKDLRMAKLIMTQLGGPNGEMAACSNCAPRELYKHTAFLSSGLLSKYKFNSIQAN